MTHEQQTLAAYVEWLIESNQKTTATQDLAKFSNMYLWGVASEVFEVQAATPEKLINECGDVLAYAVLALYAGGESKETIVNKLSQQTMEIDPNPILLDYTNALTKFYRGDAGTHRQIAIECVYRFVAWASTVSSLRPYALSIYNKEKLEKRLANVGTFQGSGER